MGCRTGRTVIVLAALVVAGCGSEPGPSFDGEKGTWSRWASASGGTAGALRYYMPADPPAEGSIRNGEVKIDQELGSMRAFLIAREGSGEQLADPFLVLASQRDEDLTVGAGGEPVDIGGHPGRLVRADPSALVGWKADGATFLVTAPIALEDEALQVARGVRTSPFDGSRPTHVPDGFEIVTRLNLDDAIGSTAMGTEGTGMMTDGDGFQMLFVSSMRIEGVDPWALTAFGQATMRGEYRRTTVRGADAVELGVAAPSGGFGGIALSWMEHEDVLVTVMAAGKGATSDGVRAIAESLREVDREAWRERYPSREASFGRS